MEIGNIIVFWDSMEQFIEKHCQPVNSSYAERFENEHPLLMSKFNWELKEDSIHYTVFGIPIEQLYVYRNKDSKFAVYILFELTAFGLDQLSAALGYPENVPTKEAFHAMDFDFLFWKNKKFEIFINRSHLGKRKGLHRMQIFNMPYSDTIIQQEK